MAAFTSVLLCNCRQSEFGTRPNLLYFSVFLIRANSWYKTGDFISIINSLLIQVPHIWFTHSVFTLLYTNIKTNTMQSKAISNGNNIWTLKSFVCKANVLMLHHRLWECQNCSFVLIRSTDSSTKSSQESVTRISSDLIIIIFLLINCLVQCKLAECLKKINKNVTHFAWEI